MPGASDPVSPLPDDCGPGCPDYRLCHRPYLADSRPILSEVCQGHLTGLSAFQLSRASRPWQDKALFADYRPIVGRLRVDRQPFEPRRKTARPHLQEHFQISVFSILLLAEGALFHLPLPDRPVPSHYLRADRQAVFASRVPARAGHLRCPATTAASRLFQRQSARH